ALDLLGLDMLWHHHDRVLAGGERRRLAFDELVDADDDLLARFDRLEPSRVRFDELRLHVADLDRGGRASKFVDLLELRLGLSLQRRDFFSDFWIAVENVAI